MSDLAQVLANQPRKLTVECVEFKTLEKNTLRGFAEIRNPDMRMRIKDVTVHEKDGRRWAALPGKPQINKERQLVTDASGKVQYTPVLCFESRAVSDAFSEAVLKAVDDYRRKGGAS